MWKIDKPEVAQALIKIAKTYGGVINPQAVVECAADERSVLHRYFEWDDTEAARKWRIEQARDLLAVVVEYLPDDVKRAHPIRVFYSLTDDRVCDGGYRTTVSILSDVAMHARLLEDARADMELFRRKYMRLTELKGVLDAMVGALRHVKAKRKHKAA
jgi:hypothetical protein